MMVQDFLIDKNLKLFTFSQDENHISNKDKKWDVGSRKFQALFLLVISTHFSIFIKSVGWNSFFHILYLIPILTQNTKKIKVYRGNKTILFSFNLFIQW